MGIGERWNPSTGIQARATAEQWGEFKIHTGFVIALSERIRRENSVTKPSESTASWNAAAQFRMVR